jgi:hypothetical protein
MWEMSPRVDVLKPILRFRMKSQRDVAGSKAGLLKVGTLASAALASRRLP